MQPPPHLPLKLLAQLLIAPLRLPLRHRAHQALAAATESQACCEANRESMERMFQKSMSK